MNSQNPTSIWGCPILEKSLAYALMVPDRFSQIMVTTTTIPSHARYRWHKSYLLIDIYATPLNSWNKFPIYKNWIKVLDKLT